MNRMLQWLMSPAPWRRPPLAIGPSSSGKKPQRLTSWHGSKQAGFPGFSIALSALVGRGVVERQRTDVPRHQFLFGFAPNRRNCALANFPSLLQLRELPNAKCVCDPMSRTGWPAPPTTNTPPSARTKEEVSGAPKSIFPSQASSLLDKGRRGCNCFGRPPLVHCSWLSSVLREMSAMERYRRPNGESRVYFPASSYIWGAVVFI